MSSGSKIKTRSAARVVRGAAGPLRTVREEIQLDLNQAASGQMVTYANVMRKAGSPSSGRLVNDFTVAITEGTPQGRTTVKLALYVNGKLVERRPGTLQIAQSDSP